MTDFAHTLPPALRRQLRRRPLNLPPPVGSEGYRVGGDGVVPFDLAALAIASEMAVVDCLTPDQRRVLNVIGLLRFKILFPETWTVAQRRARHVH